MTLLLHRQLLLYIDQFHAAVVKLDRLPRAKYQLLPGFPIFECGGVRAGHRLKRGVLVGRVVAVVLIAHLTDQIVGLSVIIVLMGRYGRPRHRS